MNILLIAIAVLILIAGFYFLSKKNSGASSPGTDAGRFARLLVSEIKLYNEQKVLHGLQNSNLSDTLRDEIGQARKMYQKQFPNAEDVAHFERALIEILADGDQSRLDSGIKSSLR